jgi:hypothetical protein
MIGDEYHVDDSPAFVTSLTALGAFGDTLEGVRVDLTTDAATYPGNESFEFEF